MRRIFSGRSTFVTVIAAAALIVVAGGSGAVAGGLITSAKIKNGTIQSIDVRNNNLRSVDILNGSLTGTDLRDESVGSADITNYSLSNQDVNVFYASVYSDGSLGGSSGGVTSSKLDIGIYEVDFGSRDISGCAFTATPAAISGLIAPSNRQINVADRFNNLSAVFVKTENGDAGAAVDQGFHLTVVC